MPSFKNHDIVLLLGAGASVEADIPHSSRMVSCVEDLVKNDPDWKKYCELYNYLRSSIFYSDGIKGRIGNDVSYNIERLIGILDELLKRDEHSLFPFVGAWNPKLLEVVGGNFEKVQEFRDKIVGKLRNDWVPIDEIEKAEYFNGIVKFQKELEYPLRVFSLNYDLCLELACRKQLGDFPERGFEERTWDWRKFEENPNDQTRIYLYKLHGSIDWKYNSNKQLSYSDSPQAISQNEMAMIFGTTYKLQYLDPFLFLTYEFRKWTLESKLIISVGYGFGDEHINGIIGQALNRRPTKLLAIFPFGEGNEDEKKECETIKKALDFEDATKQKVHCQNFPASTFFKEQLSISKLVRLFPDEEDPFQELS